MTKISSIFLTTLVFGMLACGSMTPPPSGALQSTPEPASTPQDDSMPTNSSAAEPSSALGESTTVAPESLAAVTVSVPGLRIVYLRGGNLWSWTEAGGSVQLTDTADMSVIRISEDGQLLAFMRGSEIWTVRMDGTDARLLGAQASDGGALRFAPNNALLAISTSDHIDLVDLNTGSMNTVASYPALSDSYYPEVVWMPDSSGFKTVIPAPSASGQAEMQYIFMDGTVASLAKFSMISSADKPYFFSPDGGYVIYTALVDEKESLYLMDSSGATRPYGEAATDVRALGWLPDSKHFLYGWEEPQRTFFGSVDGPAADSGITFGQTIRWIDAEHHLVVQDGNLYLGNVNGDKMLIDVQVSEFDFDN